MNITRANTILKWLANVGVTDICICPGGRNAPFVQALQDNPYFSVTTAFDERAAGFFAFGRSYSQQRPAAVITTSGTAASEVFSSVIEAQYSGAPLIVITADRPHQLRDTGSPQVINQLNIFGDYVEKCVDVDWNQEWRDPDWSQLRPLHINIAFEEPLIDSSQANWTSVPVQPQPQKAQALNTLSFVKSCSQFSSSEGAPLLIVGPLHLSELALAQSICAAWPGIIYLEAASGLRENVFKNKIISGEKYLSKLLKSEKLSGVLRLGGVPTLKLWRELESSHLPVVSVSSRPFKGMSRGEFFHASFQQSVDIRFDIATIDSVIGKIIQADKLNFAKQQTLLKKYPQSEPSLIHFLSQALPTSEHVYLGNIMVNRGANGIDGQISSAIGMSSREDSLSVVLGDLTALYDATGLWFKESVQSLRIFVINNNGGRIFERIFQNPAFYNAHDVNFAALAKMWNMKHFKIHSAQAAIIAEGIYEVLPDATQTRNFWEEYDKSDS
jgi:2-succinyl-5-enolpyruvyl-6-hydroxy-3-cyclohexene-1-carboxylate synthase